MTNALPGVADIPLPLLFWYACWVQWLKQPWGTRPSFSHPKRGREYEHSKPYRRGLKPSSAPAHCGTAEAVP
jgi:hypothetical protein